MGQISIEILEKEIRDLREQLRTEVKNAFNIGFNAGMRIEIHVALPLKKYGEDIVELLPKEKVKVIRTAIREQIKCRFTDSLIHSYYKNIT